jgi:hypothetical protein
MKKCLMLCLFGLSLGAFVGCGPTLYGAREVDANYTPRIVAKYGAEGDVPKGTRYALVQDGTKVAIFETLAGQPSRLIERRWQDGDGMHFVMWSPASAVEHFLVPPQPGAAAFRWIYPPGLFTIEKEGDIERPVPKIQFEAATKLTPIGAR